MQPQENQYVIVILYIIIYFYLVKLIQADVKKSKFLVGRVLATYGLNLIQMIVKLRYINMSQKDPTFMSICNKFEPLTQLILNCLKSADNNIVAASMKILNIIIQWPLKTIKRQYKKIISSSLEVIVIYYIENRLYI